MAKAIEIIKELRRDGVQLYLEEGELRFKAKKGVFTDERKKLVSENKSEIIESLKAIELMAHSASYSLPQIKRSNSKANIPLSFSQQRLWFIDQLLTQSLQFNMCSEIMLSGAMKRSAFQSALNQLVERHEVLRTCYKEINGDVFQEVAQPENVKYDYFDMSRETQTEAANKIARIKELEASKPFDLTSGPILRVNLVSLSSFAHLVIFTVHHIASDGWSLRIFEKELKQLYAACYANQAYTLEPLKLQYGDFAIWQREWCQGDVLDKHLSFWKDNLNHAPEVHSLPIDYCRPSIQTNKGALVESQIGTVQLGAVKSLCKKHNLSLFIFLETLFALLVARLSNESDVLIGTPTAGRSQEALEGLIGFFVNTLILRTKISSEQSIKDLLLSNRRVVLDAQNHEILPFDKIVEEISPERNASYNPIVQISIGIQTSAESLESSIGEKRELLFESLSHDLNIPFELKLDIYEFKDEVVLAWIYNKKIFNESSVQRFAEDFDRLLSSVIESFAKYDGEFPNVLELGMSAMNEDGAIEKSGQDRHDTGRLVHEMFEETVNEFGSALALKCDEQEISYEDLEKQSNQLAHYLVANDVKPENKVALMLERSIDCVAVALAILKCGAVYVPIDAEYPTERVQYILEDSQSRLVVSRKKYVNKLTSQTAPVVCLDSDEFKKQLQKTPSAKLRDSSQPYNSMSLAYIIYTSGSTGKPKGVQISHESVCEFLEQAVVNFVNSNIEGAIVSSTLAFDATVGSLWVPLVCGLYAELVPEDSRSIEILAKRLCETDKSYLFKLTPSHLEAVQSTQFSKQNTSSNHILVVAGEPLHWNTLTKWANDLLPNSTIFNEYGPTEATVGCTIFNTDGVSRRPDSPIKTVPIGKVLGDTQLYVLNDYLMPQSTMSIGELYVGGCGLARGYNGKPNLTAEKFIPNPYSSVAGARIYKTGDLVRILTCGNIEFIGRVDNQIKIRGYRIETSEIESALLALDEVQEAAVLVKVDDKKDKFIAAFIVVNGAEQPQACELKNGNKNASENYTGIQNDRIIGVIKAKIAKYLPTFMIPTKFVFKSELPLNSNGKVDRLTLAKEQEFVVEKSRYIAPSTVTQKRMCKIWEELLGVEQVGIEDSFFALGGHSLLATKLVSRIRENFNLNFPLRIIFETQSLSQICEYIDECEVDDDILPLDKANNEEPLLLSFSQQRLWFIDRLGEGSKQFNMPGFFMINGQVSIESLKNAFAEIIRRHAVLRTIFVEKSGVVVQEVLEKYELPFRFIDLSHESDELKQNKVESFFQAETAREFLLDSELKIRLLLIKVNPDKYMVHYTMHHIASDAWSRKIFLNELSQLYQAFKEHKESPLAELRVQYADYSVWQRKRLEDSRLKDGLAYWKSKLANIPAVHSLPLDKVRPAKQRFMGRSLVHRVGKPVLSRINQLNQAHNTTLFIFMHSVFALLIARYSNESDIVVGSAVSGRSHRDTENLIGFFLNDIVLRGNISGSATFDDLLGQYKESILEALENQEVPFELLVEELKPKRSLSHSPVFQIKLDVQSGVPAELNLEGADTIKETSEDVTMVSAANEHHVKHDLYINVIETADGFSVYWLYNSDLFYDHTIEQLSRHFINLINVVLDKSDIKLNDIELLEENEKRNILSMSESTAEQQTGTISGECHSGSVLTMFEDNVSRFPKQIAVKCNEQELTYEELDIQTNQLANYLILKGLQPGNNVAICVERSTEMLIGILTILKCGCAYVPLNPNTPQDRIDFILEDSNSNWLLTQNDIQAELSFNNQKVIPLDKSIRKTFTANCSGDSVSNKNCLSREQLAYILYTSGSTGIPKGVMVNNASLFDYCSYGLNKYYENQLVGATILTSYCFDLTVPSLFIPLMSGGCVSLLSEGTEFEELTNQITAPCPPQLLRLTPSHIKGLLAYLGEGQCLTEHVFVIGGEALSYQVIDALRAHFPKARIFNHYGPTESVVGCSIYSVDTLMDDSVLPRCPIGRAMDDRQLLVLNDELQLNPVGVPGQLCVSGRSLSNGYLNQPKLTAEKFLPNPYANEFDTRLYQTGDLVRYLADGNIDYLGRIDNQVKVRGFRIELSEIEKAMSQLDDVKESAILVSSSADSEQKIVAYVVLRQSLDFDVEEEVLLLQQKSAHIKSIRAQLANKLPDYMIPSVYVFIECLPLNSNGKLNANALPEPDEADLVRAHYIAPRNDTERRLCCLWKEILRLDQIGVEDDFFLMGGHSLLATSLVNLIRQEFEVEIQLRVIFEKPTVAGISEEITNLLIDKKTIENQESFSDAEEFEEIELG